MRILIADDEMLLLEHMNRIVKELQPEADVFAFRDAELLIDEAKANGVDVAFLDIRMPEMTGIEVAHALIDINPKVNIIFVTGYNDYREEAMDIFASGYVKKPATREKITDQLAHLRYPVASKKRIKVTTDKFFRVTVDDQPLQFERKKTVEFLAYLIYLQGKPIRSAELRRVLFSEKSVAVDNSNSYFSHIKRDLRQAFSAFGVEDVLQFNSNRMYAIDMSKIECDTKGMLLLDALNQEFGWDNQIL